MNAKASARGFIDVFRWRGRLQEVTTEKPKRTKRGEKVKDLIRSQISAGIRSTLRCYTNRAQSRRLIDRKDTKTRPGLESGVC